MRIVHVINRLVHGGSEKQLIELTTRGGLDHEIIELSGIWSSRLRGIYQLSREIRARRPHIVVAWLDRSQVAASLAAPRGVPLVAQLGGMPRRSGFLEGWMMRSTFRRFDCLVANSQTVRTATAAFMRPLRCTDTMVIPNGVDFIRGPSNDTVRRRTAAAPFRVGFIGRANPDKGLDILVSALKDPSLPPLEVTFVGAGIPDALSGVSLPHDWQKHGRISDPWAAVEPLDVLVLPSRTEGSPNVVTEAFARGVPVVGTEAGGATELLADGRGLLVPCEDPPALARGIATVWADPRSAEQRAVRAAAYVKEVHSWSHVVQMWERLLRALSSVDA